METVTQNNVGQDHRPKPILTESKAHTSSGNPGDGCYNVVITARNLRTKLFPDLFHQDGLFEEAAHQHTFANNPLFDPGCWQDFNSELTLCFASNAFFKMKS